MELLYFASNLLFPLKCKFSYRTKRKIEMEMKPLEITKLRRFCETRQGFFLITLLESSGFFEPYCRFLAFSGQNREEKTPKIWKTLECNIASKRRRGCCLETLHMGLTTRPPLLIGYPLLP